VGIALVAASISAAPATACPNAGTLSVLLSATAVEQSVVCLINGQRAANGLQQVGYQANLRQAALGHSQEMVERGYFAHDSPSGSTPLSRILASGYADGFKRWEFGENLAWGSNLHSTPQRLVDAWMASPPHRQNLLYPRFNEIGAAAVKGTPNSKLDLLGVTVTTEYGWRSNVNPAAKKCPRKRKRSTKGKRKSKRCGKRRPR
jgi:uncharacterized protein YkwD